MSNLRLSSWVLGPWSLVSGLASYALAKTQDQRPKLQLSSNTPLYLLQPLHVAEVQHALGQRGCSYLVRLWRPKAGLFCPGPRKKWAGCFYFWRIFAAKE